MFPRPKGALPSGHFPLRTAARYVHFPVFLILVNLVKLLLTHQFNSRTASMIYLPTGVKVYLIAVIGRFRNAWS
jgi:hypothetical protein